VRYDGFVLSVHNGETPLLANKKFDLTTATGVTQETGVYLICDGGYHHWRCLQCPRPHSSDRDTQEWTRQLTSVRKDVECTFGVLKARFRMLKLPQLWTDKAGDRVGTKVENVFLTCCVLHNMLLSKDDRDPTRTEVLNGEHEDVGVTWVPARRNQTGAVGRAALILESHTDLSGVGRSTASAHVQECAGWAELQRKLIVHYAHRQRRSTLHPGLYHQGWRYTAPSTSTL
jgi:hypothetical protein